MRSSKVARLKPCVAIKDKERIIESSKDVFNGAGAANTAPPSRRTPRMSTVSCGKSAAGGLNLRRDY